MPGNCGGKWICNGAKLPNIINFTTENVIASNQIESSKNAFTMPSSGLATVCLHFWIVRAYIVSVWEIAYSRAKSNSIDLYAYTWSLRQTEYEWFGSSGGVGGAVYIELYCWNRLWHRFEGKCIRFQSLCRQVMLNTSCEIRQRRKKRFPPNQPDTHTTKLDPKTKRKIKTVDERIVNFALKSPLPSTAHIEHMKYIESKASEWETWRRNEIMWSGLGELWKMHFLHIEAIRMKCFVFFFGGVSYGCDICMHAQRFNVRSP